MSKPTILIIEDDKILQELYRERFSESLHILQAFDGQEGLDLFKKHPEIKVILVDIMLPRLSGYEVVSQIRQGALLADIPILISSALSASDDRKKGMQLGATDYLAKGEISPSQLLEQILRYAQSEPAKQND